ncbi:hypothetical protein FJR48_08480 [Sulfurimonas lithotrophica]|uniref:Uncharacterized protein n=1 Tax=Sulfurimonas lithotrophica TaxID=2590022 RepID=A0A5P8P209_9BACT|nr:hypothetical protein [Sulfurimonas lithotrophica]QFR49762.1 hypothetical protein FJR48_08480 [Sulfurimonas lithotrophica]
MRKKRNIINLYKDKNINSVKYVISIENEEDLDQFWDFLNSNIDSNRYIHIFIELLYNFTHTYILKDEAKFFEIIIEENDSNIYFTIWNKKVIKSLDSYFSKSSLKYKYDNKKLTIKLKKEVSKKLIQKIEQDHIEIEKKLNSPTFKPSKPNTNSNFIKPYNFIDDEDLNDIIRINDDLHDILYRGKKLGITEDILIELRSSLSMFLLNIKYYKQVSEFSKTIDSFLVLLIQNTDKFLTNNKKKITLIEKLINNIDTWINRLFVNGGKELYFLDKVMHEDYLMLQEMVYSKKKS